MKALGDFFARITTRVGTTSPLSDAESAKLKGKEGNKLSKALTRTPSDKLKSKKSLPQPDTGRQTGRHLSRHTSQEAALSAASAALVKVSATVQAPPADPNVFCDSDTDLLELIVNNCHLVLDIEVLEHDSKIAPISLYFIRLDSMPVTTIFSNNIGELTVKSFIFKPNKRKPRLSGGILPIPVYMRLNLGKDKQEQASLEAKEKEVRRTTDSDSTTFSPAPILPPSSIVDKYMAPTELPIRRRTQETIENSQQILNDRIQVPDDVNVFCTPDMSLLSLMAQNGHLVAEVFTLERDSRISPISVSYISLSSNFHGAQFPFDLVTS